MEMRLKAKGITKVEFPSYGSTKLGESNYFPHMSQELKENLD